MRDEQLDPEMIEFVTIHSFEKATQLSKGIPSHADEAQYNIAYPVTAAILWGDVGMDQLKKEAFDDPRVPQIMKKLRYIVDPEMERAFPEKRFCQAEFALTDARVIRSSVCEPRGEAKENIGVQWVSEKFRRMTSSLLKEVEQEKVLTLLTETKATSIREIVDTINGYLCEE